MAHESDVQTLGKINSQFNPLSPKVSYWHQFRPASNVDGSWQETKSMK